LYVLAILSVNKDDIHVPQNLFSVQFIHIVGETIGRPMVGNWCRKKIIKTKDRRKLLYATWEM